MSTQGKFRNKRLESRSPRTNRPTEPHRLLSLDLSSKAVFQVFQRMSLTSVNIKFTFFSGEPSNCRACKCSLQTFEEITIEYFFFGLVNTYLSVSLSFTCGHE